MKETNHVHEVHNHYEAGANCQVFNGPVSGAVFAMPGSTVNQYGTTCQAQQPRRAETEAAMCQALCTADAMTYWRRLQEAGFVDADCQLLPCTTRQQAMYIAEVFAQRLGMKAKWKPFQDLWGIRNLAQEKNKCMETGRLPPRAKDIEALFDD